MSNQALISTLHNSFELVNCSYYGYSQNSSNENPRSRFMTVPIMGDSFEIPVFTLTALKYIKPLPGDDKRETSIIVTLDSANVSTTYKTLDAGIRDLFHICYENCRLVKLPPLTNSDREYFATLGAIFDDNFSPVMMLTWEVRKISSEGEPPKYRFVRPILRIIPEVLLNKSNTVKRYIVNRILPGTLDLNYIGVPKTLGYDLFEEYDNNPRFKAKVVIENMPFEVRDTYTPSIETTNRELLDIALDNLNEIV